MKDLKSIFERYCLGECDENHEEYQDSLYIRQMFRDASAKDHIKKFRDDAQIRNYLEAARSRSRPQNLDIEEELKVSDHAQPEELAVDYHDLADLDKEDASPRSDAPLTSKEAMSSFIHEESDERSKRSTEPEVEDNRRSADRKETGSQIPMFN
jgi:hypothetical protein